jgi:hypothetical protein
MLHTKFFLALTFNNMLTERLSAPSCGPEHSGYITAQATGNPCIPVVKRNKERKDRSEC